MFNMLKRIKKFGNSHVVVLDSEDMKCHDLKFDDIINVIIKPVSTGIAEYSISTNVPKDEEKGEKFKKDWSEFKRLGEKLKITCGKKSDSEEKATWHPSDIEIIKGGYSDNHGYVEGKIKELVALGEKELLETFPMYEREIKKFLKKNGK